MIKHIWFDFEGTLTKRTDEFNRIHDELRYKTYSEAVKKPLTNELKKEFDALYRKHGSNSAVFRHLGFESDYWQKKYCTIDKKYLYMPIREIIETLKKLKSIVPISLYTNLKMDEILLSLKIIKIEKSWFKFILSGDDVKERKPKLDGFYEMIRKSALPPEEIMYVGDRIKVDVIPAKKLGMKTCLVWAKSNEADYSFEKFENILSIFG